MEDVRYCIRRRHVISLGTILIVTLNQGTGAGVSGVGGSEQGVGGSGGNRGWRGTVGQAVGLLVGDTVGVLVGLSLGELVGEAEVRAVKLG